MDGGLRLVRLCFCTCLAIVIIIIIKFGLGTFDGCHDSPRRIPGAWSFTYSYSWLR